MEICIGESNISVKDAAPVSKQAGKQLPVLAGAR